jgi:hypothetical protein
MLRIIHKGYFVIEKLESIVGIKAFWYTKYFFILKQFKIIVLKKDERRSANRENLFLTPGLVSSSCVKLSWRSSMLLSRIYLILLLKSSGASMER